MGCQPESLAYQQYTEIAIVSAVRVVKERDGLRFERKRQVNA